MPISTSDALTGLGTPAQLAAVMGANPNVLTTKGTTQGGAAVLLSRNTELSPAASQTGAIPPATAGVMEPYFLINTSASSTTAKVYVPVGHTLSTPTNGGLNGSFSLPVSTSAIFWQYKPKFWAVNLSAAVS